MSIRDKKTSDLREVVTQMHVLSQLHLTRMLSAMMITNYLVL